MDEFEELDPDWIFAYCPERLEDFPAYVQMLEDWSKGMNLPGNFVANTFLIGALENQIVGRVSIRHEFNDFLEKFGGHIGYCVLPSHRSRGYATEMLRLSLPVARSLGLKKVLITCDEDNTASRRVIEKNGGVYENTLDGDEVKLPKRRYWLQTK